MNSRWQSLVLIIVIAAAAALGGYWFGTHGHAHDEEAKSDEPASTQPAEAQKPVVPVVTAPLTVAPIAEAITAFGTVVAEAGDVRAVSVPFESRVLRVLVTPGQQVAPATPLVAVEASPDAVVALAEAKNAVEAAARDLKQTEQRFAEHLATNVELSQAQQAAQSAKLKLQSLLERGVGEKHELKAEFAGIVSKVDVEEGQIMPPGLPLLELAAGNRIEVRLNVEPSDAQRLKSDADVRLQPVDAPIPDKPIAGKIRLIARRVDPATRLVEVRVSLPPDTPLMLDTFVTAALSAPATEGFVVPRSAALPTEEGDYEVFSVKDQHAVVHHVRLGAQQDQLAQIIGEDLKAGDPIVVHGNYLLEDGSEVTVTASAASSATQPTSAHAEADK